MPHASGVTGAFACRQIGSARLPHVGGCNGQIYSSFWRHTYLPLGQFRRRPSADTYLPLKRVRH